jgi:hypothetical protein
MLFPVMSRLQNVRLIGAKITTASTPSFTTNINPDEFVAPSRTGTGTFTLPLRHGSSRLLQMFGTPDSENSPQDGGFVSSTSIASQTSTISGLITGTNGTATDSSAQILIAASNSRVTDRVKLNPVLGCKRQELRSPWPSTHQINH